MCLLTRAWWYGGERVGELPPPLSSQTKMVFVLTGIDCEQSPLSLHWSCLLAVWLKSCAGDVITVPTQTCDNTIWKVHLKTQFQRFIYDCNLGAVDIFISAPALGQTPRFGSDPPFLNVVFCCPIFYNSQYSRYTYWNMTNWRLKSIQET